MLGIPIGRDALPSLFIETEIEAGQDDGATRGLRNRGEQAGGGAIAARRTDGDNRAFDAAALNGMHLLGDEAHAPGRSIDEIMCGQDLRPLLHGNVEEIQGDPPIPVEFRQDQRIELFPGDVFDDEFVDETDEFAGKMPRIDRGRPDEQGFARIRDRLAVAIHGDDRMTQRIGPGKRQLGALHAPP